VSFAFSKFDPEALGSPLEIDPVVSMFYRVSAASVKLVHDPIALAIFAVIVL
jgi:hypothetical protein